ncbi:hypothetical protein CTI12_AA300900 [Artemisia annua]|uniref:Uncharacterized protein n=1 Tax=Artemisia annua TaxID=35608 RepID=A0A2U1N6L6_ARTAN|nr:hypothetical protein CTI12_AA300900 [Artemisia annua]
MLQIILISFRRESRLMLCHCHTSFSQRFVECSHFRFAICLLCSQWVYLSDSVVPVDSTSGTTLDMRGVP